eukprot:gnl/TRDRNA2_/TRDRNA2_181602_c0_seq1.p3 gnl/TRDRNA2_/TRDRNA2_181602_c0~~gnl/TRDRNA2_/TRDRNA2_181602_c0_seq1.p3  ORF type:complete len:124 (-),score=36.60 gnl/TRDRNA2_/TRDRNA2_181602_c0_seq1:67-438(-)
MAVLRVVVALAMLLGAAAHLKVSPIEARNTSAVVVLPAALEKLGMQCGCTFKGTCNCKGAIEFMDCISDMCASHRCDCKETTFQDGCKSMDNACQDISMECTKTKATCVVSPEEAKNPPKKIE